MLDTLVCQYALRYVNNTLCKFRAALPRFLARARPERRAMVCSSLERASALLVRHTDLCFAHANCDAAGEVALTEACALVEPEPLALHRLQVTLSLSPSLSPT